MVVTAESREERSVMPMRKPRDKRKRREDWQRTAKARDEDP